MRIVIQRVSQARVEVNRDVVGQINKGLLIFLGVGHDDHEEGARALASKVALLRIFDDEQGKMNRSILEAKAEVLVVSQFTLYGDCSKGRRPSFDKAAPPETAEKLYEYFIEQLKAQDIPVQTGRFRAMMDVHLVNDGPVTFVLES